MLEHGAGVCQGESSPPAESLNNGPREGSLLDTHGISSKSPWYQGFRDDIGDAFRDAGLYDEYYKWTQCGKKVIPFKCQECEGEFYVPFRCDLRICPKCNRRYVGLFRARYLRTINQLLKRKKGRDRLMLLTLTTKNTGEIPSAFEIKAHNKAIGKLIKKFFKGGVSVNEVKGTYLHSHCIVYGPYTPQNKLSKEWEALTGAKIVDIRQIHGKSNEICREITKYIKKPYRVEGSQNGHSLAIQFLKNFKGVRRVHSFGLFYNLPREKRPAWVCPYCRSESVYLNWEKFYEEDLTIRECKMLGILSFKEIQKAWETTFQKVGYA